MIKQLIMTGGIGNQMFEYAAYINMIRSGLKIKRNVDMYNVNIMHHGYLLKKVFDIPDADITHSNNFTIFITRLLRRFNLFGLVYREHYDKYSTEFLTTKSIYIDGVFVGERYFSNVKDEIRKIFTFKSIDEHNRKLGETMETLNSVSLHIRRGDYLKYPQFQVCTDSYYLNAVETILSKVNNPYFYIFSDDISYAKNLFKNLQINYEIIDFNIAENSYKDMYLMTKCHHNIISNSTFSWWGAWLNSYKDKIVICPDSYLSGIDFTPYLDEWIKLPKYD